MWDVMGFCVLAGDLESARTAPQAARAEIARLAAETARLSWLVNGRIIDTLLGE